MHNPSSPIWIANQIALQSAAKSSGNHPMSTIESIIAGVLIAAVVVLIVVEIYVMWREWR